MRWKELWKSYTQSRFLRYGTIALLAATVLILIYRRPPVTTETHRVQPGAFEVFIEEDGLTRVREKFTLYAPASGVMMRVQKHAGDAIRKNEILTQVMLDYMRPVRAPTAGTVLKVYRESEGPIEMGTPIADIGDTRHLEIVADVLTRDSVALRPGIAVVISGWGGGNLPGKIRRVEPAAFTRVSTLGVEEQRVHVLVDFERPQDMGEGFEVRCRMILRRMENALTVPIGAVFREGEAWFLYKVVAGKAQKARVSIAETNATSALLSEGVAAGDEVILFPGEKIRNGVRVR